MAAKDKPCPLTKYVDSHFHIWDLKRFFYQWPTKDMTIYRTIEASELEKALETTPVKNAVFVQVLNDCVEESQWVADLAKQYSFIKGIVAGINVSRPEVEEQVHILKTTPLVVGVRHILDYEPPDWLNRPEVHRGLELLAQNKLTFDLTLRPHLLKYAVPLAKKFSNLKMVVNHLAKPDIQAGPVSPEWQKGLEELAACPNVYCKLSGFVNEAGENWTPADFTPYLNVAITAFGSDRCMFGSDWPVCTTVNASYSKVFETLLYCIQDLPDESQEDIFGRTAVKFYGLQNLD